MFKRFQKELRKTDEDYDGLSSSDEDDSPLEKNEEEEEVEFFVPTIDAETPKDDIIEEKSLVTVDDLERALDDEETSEEDENVEEKFYQCSLCPEIKLKTLKDVSEHIEGKVHKKRELRKQARKEKAKNKKRKRSNN